ncbi:hypothetical protein WJX84_000887 [Apatococcus fuscideae]|uniref:Uncharacterized protein n=1 Tax=Apatococcus fuscideae TaxID=2026836 RepID=A0AAW1T9S2_9CHLO
MLGFLIYFNFIQNLVQSPSSAGPVCSQNDTLIIPAVQPLWWSCGLEVFGNFSCAGGSSFVSTIDNHLTIGQNGTSASSGGALAAAGAGSPAVAGVPSTAAAAATSGTPLAIPAGITTDSVPDGPATATSINGLPAIATSGSAGRKMLQADEQVSTSTKGPGSMASGFTSVPGAPPISSSQQNGNGTTQTITSGPGSPPIVIPSVPATLTSPPGPSSQQELLQRLLQEELCQASHPPEPGLMPPLVRWERAR